MDNWCDNTVDEVTQLLDKQFGMTEEKLNRLVKFIIQREEMEMFGRRMSDF